ncbi:MAG: hypothetical protein JNM63_04680, partial [Spirochaetia bacterium]|nr:hypothetical protein [Spirochaetia bacterium]
MIRIFKKTLIGPTGVALGLVFFLASCDVTSPSVVVTNLGPSVKCEFLTGTNLVKVGVSRYFGSGVFSPSAEFSRLSANDVNPTPYAVLPTPTNYVVGYAYWTGSDWSSW